MAIRPEGVRLNPDSRIRAIVAAKSFEGGTPVSRLRLGEATITTAELDLPKGSDVGLAIDACLIFDTGGHLIAAIG